MMTESRDAPEPTREEVRGILAGLASGQLTRAQASDWATPWITEEAGFVEDEAVWEALDWLSGADMETAPDVYLYGPEDFCQWLANFEAATAG